MCTTVVYMLYMKLSSRYAESRISVCLSMQTIDRIALKLCIEILEQSLKYTRKGLDELSLLCKRGV